MAEQSYKMEGKITLKDYDQKVELARSKQVDPVKSYVKKFDEVKNAALT